MDDGRAVGVAYLQGGVEHVVRAERGVVLCGGAVNTPQLLMLLRHRSGRPPPRA